MVHVFQHVDNENLELGWPACIQDMHEVDHDVHDICSI